MQLIAGLTMQNSSDLFSYPQTPGYRDRDTSRSAALDLAGDASLMREKVFAAITRPMTDWQIAEAAGMEFHLAQPRRSELVAAGRVKFSGEYGISPRSGKRVKLWCRC